MSFLKYAAVYALTPPEIKIDFNVVLTGALADIVSLLKELGYDGVEINISDPMLVDSNEVIKEVEEKALEIPVISTGLSYLRYGFSLSASDNEREKAIKILHEHMKIAYKLKSNGIVIGLIRGKCPKKELYNICMKKLIDSLSQLNRHAENLNLNIYIEPMNRSITNLINSVNEAIEIVEKLGSEKMKILFDTYHASLEEKNIYKAIEKASKHIGYIHVADDNRGIPGTGNLDWVRIMKKLRSVGYNGYLSLEAIMGNNIALSLKKTVNFLKSIEKDASNR